MTETETITTDAPRADAPVGDRPRVASMLATAYSGATLFAILLNRHGRITCDGETFPPPRGYRMNCSCGRAQIECDYYREVAGHMLAPGGEAWDDDLFAHVPRYPGPRLVDRALGGFWINPAMNALRGASCALNPSWGAKQRAFLDAHDRFFRASLARNGTEVYVDGAKSYRRCELLAGTGRYDYRLVHLVRDGRGFCRSHVKNKKLTAGALPEAARIWNRSLRRVERFAERFPSVPVLDVRYEDLCRDLEATLRRVCAFLGLPYDPSMRSEGNDPRTYHVIGNRMRASFDGVIREDLSWKTELAQGDIDSITSLMAPGLKKFGYV